MEQQAASQPESASPETADLTGLSLLAAAEMVRVPAGAFTMGSPASEVDSLLQYYPGMPRDLFLNEIGVHTVELAPFFIDRFAVSNAQFRRFIVAGGYERQEWWSPTGWNWRITARRNAPGFWHWEESALDEHPVVGITWYEADAYARSVKKRLPSEAEWEKAARGIDVRRYPWGDIFELDRCNTADFWLHREIREYNDWYVNFFLRRPWREHTVTTPANSFPTGASPYGALNMGGNVWEWCTDWYATNYYAHSPAHNPQGAEYGSEKVCRGGSFGYFGWSARSTDRGHHPLPTIHWAWVCAALRMNNESGRKPMLTDDLWSPGQFMNELFSYYDTHAPMANYFVLSSGLNHFPMTRTWKKLLQLEIEHNLSYPLYTSSLGLPCSSRSVMTREIFAATEGRVYADQFDFTLCMTIGAAQAVAIVFAYLARHLQNPAILLLGFNHPLFEQLARYYHISITEMIGEEQDTSTTLPCAEAVAQEIVRARPSMVIIVQPNNPSGEVYTEAELATIFRAARHTESLLLLDQVGQLPISFDPWINVNKVLVSTQTQTQALLVQSFSKTDSIPGFRIGYLAVPPALAEFVVQYQQCMIMNPQTILTLPVFLSSLARCLFLSERMKWLDDKDKLFLARFFYGMGKMSLGDFPSHIAQELSPTSLLNLSHEYKEEHLQNYITIQENRRYVYEKLQHYISRKTACQGGFNCLVEFEPFARKDELSVCQELFQATNIAILPESSFRISQRIHKNNFWVRVSLAVPQTAFQTRIDMLATFLAQ